jgi:phosphate-selective porin OprO and OprP
MRHAYFAIVLAICWPRSSWSQEIAPTAFFENAARGDLPLSAATYDQSVFTATAAAVLPTIEDRVLSLEKELKKQADAAAKKRESDAQKPSFQIGGQLQIDYLWFGQDEANRGIVGDVPDVIDFRRARFVARGGAFETLEYMIGFDFALSGRPSFLDVWMGATDLPYVGHARVGHFFEPFSLERNTQNHRNTFMERSLADAFAPARNVGIEIYDSLGEEERASYRLGWYAANSDNFGDQFTDTGGQALTGRLTWLPVWNDDGRTFMHVGAAYSYRTPPNHLLAFATTPEARPGSPGPTNVPNFVNTGAIAADHNQLVGLEYALVYGPLYIQTEYIAAPVDQLGAPDLYFDGAYINVSYFLTGENRTYNKLFGILDRVFPDENFFRVRDESGFVVNGKGAWEIAARYSTIDLTDENIQGGRMHNYTIGLNWYLNAYTRVKWELIQANLDQAPVGESQAYIAGMRFDIDF